MAPKNPTPACAPTGLAKWIPALHWGPRYEKQFLRADLVAGITLAAYLVPAAIGDASLAGLSPETGLYACLYSGLVFWLFCSSRHTVITVTSAISLLLGSTLGQLADGDSTRFGSLAAATSLMVAAIAFMAWLIKAGAIVRFISEGVMVGFKCGVALYLASTQLPKLCGFHGEHGDFWTNCLHILKSLGETNPASVIVGGIALAVLIAGKIFAPKKPVSLLVVAGGILLASLFNLEVRGVKLLGEVPQGLPRPGLPTVQWSDVNELLPLAFACFLLGAVETAAIGRMFMSKHGSRLNADQEFLALAAANLAAGLGRGLPVSGGMSQSVVNEGAGARTSLSGAFAAVLVLIVVLFFTQLLRALPQPVLAAIVLVAVAGLFKFSALQKYWQSDRLEFVVAMVALLGVLGSGLLHGVMIGAVISLVLLIRRVSRPHVAVLGRLPGTHQFSDLERHPSNERIPGVLILRPESSLIYFNVDHIHDLILNHALAITPLPGLIILDLSNAPFVDLQSTHTLAELADELRKTGTRLQVVDARSSVRERFRTEGVDLRLGGVNRSISLADAVAAFQSNRDQSHDENQ
jgi:SulP family sulfate permease